ncbi:MAG: toll/interleukin-1 receptor domain-containing protein, partial [Bellilinea sp.]
MDTTQPTVIICHASEDKNSFVIPFTYKLAEYGVRSLVDEWELQQNDSIIEKIFTEGIKNASAFLIILSNLSAHKLWVTEELRPGLIKRIAVHCKLVPVLIENAELPEVLNTAEWVKIRDLDNYDREIQQIVRIIRGDLAAAAAPVAAPAP